MLKSKRERQKFLDNEENWKLVMQDANIHIKVHRLDFTETDDVLIRISFKTKLPDDSVIECCTYYWCYADGISVPWRVDDVLERIKQINIESEAK